MRNMIIEITNEKLGYATNEMGFTFDEAIEMMAMTNDKTTDEVHEILADEAEDTEAIIQFERGAEAAWDGPTYDMEAQDELTQNLMRRGA